MQEENCIYLGDRFSPFNIDGLIGHYLGISVFREIRA